MKPGRVQPEPNQEAVGLGLGVAWTQWACVGFNFTSISISGLKQPQPSTTKEVSPFLLVSHVSPCPRRDAVTRNDRTETMAYESTSYVRLLPSSSIAYRPLCPATTPAFRTRAGAYSLCIRMNGKPQEFRHLLGSCITPSNSWNGS